MFAGIARLPMPPDSRMVSLLSQSVGVDSGHVPHVVVDGISVGGQDQVSTGLGPVSQGFMVQPQVEVGVEELPVANLGLAVSTPGRPQDLNDGSLSLEQAIDLHHGHPPIAFDIQEGLTSLPHPLQAGAAEKVPHGVLHVVGVDLLMGLELSPALLEETGVVVGDAALPMVGLLPGVQFDGAVEVGDGGFDVTQLEVLAASPVVDFHCVGIELQHGIVVGDGPTVTSLHPIELPAEMKAPRVLRIQFNGSGRQGDGPGVIPASIGALRLREQVGHGHLLGQDEARQDREGRGEAQGPKPLRGKPLLLLR